jgi:hypothetical protein
MYTTAQALTCVRLCYNLTKMYCSIDLIIVDDRTSHLVILSKTELNIEIKPNGRWIFV